MNRQIIFKLIAVFFSVYINSTQANPIISVDMVPGGVIDVSRSVIVDSAFDVNILIDGIDALDPAGRLGAFQFELEFNPLILAASTIDSGNIFGLDTFQVDSTINANSISFAELNLGTGLNIFVPTILATIHFKAIGAGTSNLDLRNTLLSDSNGISITPLTENDGQITSQEPVITAPEPSLVLLLGLGLLSLIGIQRKAKIVSLTA